MPNKQSSKYHIILIYCFYHSDTFLFNVKARRNQVTVQDLMKAYNNNSVEKKEKQKAINKIFPPKKFGL